MSDTPAAPAPPPSWGQIERLRPAEIEAIAAATPIAYLPWGALEYHGTHAATGLDSLKAHALCQALARELGGLVYPAVNLAANTIKTAPDLSFPRHSIDFSENTLRLVAREYFAQLADEGYRVVFILCGHVGQPHYDILKAEAQRADAAHAATTFIASSETDLVSPDLFIVNHAALGEVALLMASDPDCVDLSQLPADREPTLQEDAVWGPDPRPATAELGQRFTAAFVAAAAARLRPLLDAPAHPKSQLLPRPDRRA
ncbi:creatininase family protein [Actomonas aquatica]|uniref:Creatininase family protein n=1 Tax=Actomonas aquatica TaxID=2866162 RepID=A0ABZ1CCH4_9BACT|nr:creatininase family protein [Opitutus sp. WL0086]WRQ89193.1 creatininase family protein [Opitutus sp. WL0086]